MRERILVVLFLIAWLPAAELCACQCGKISSARELLERSPVAFQGVVVSKNPRLVHVEQGWFVVEEWTFAVQKAWKGVETPTVTVRQGYSNCTNIYHLGEKDVVFAYPNEANPSTLETSKCRTARGTVAEQLTDLGPPRRSFSAVSFGGESTIHRLARHATVYLFVGIAAGHNVLTLRSDYEHSLLAYSSVALAGLIIVAVVLLAVPRFRRRGPVGFLVVACVIFVLLLFASGRRYVVTFPFYWHLVERECLPC